MFQKSISVYPEFPCNPHLIYVFFAPLPLPSDIILCAMNLKT